jgi:iron complex transport system substrate-binding protein
VPRRVHLLTLVPILLTAGLLAGCGKLPTASTQAESAPALAAQRRGRADTPARAGGPVARPPISLADDLGHLVVLPHPPQRVVSLSPNLTEIVYFVGAGSRLVGVTDFCDYPPAARTRPKIGGIINPSLERVLALKPDLVLAARGNDLAFVERLRQHGLPVFATDPHSFEEVLRLIERIGALLGLAEQARVRTARLRGRLAELEARARASPTHPRALVLISLDPLFAAGRDTFIDDLLRHAGLRNAAAARGPWAKWSAERVLASAPDLLVVVAEHGGTAATRRELLAQLQHRSPWRELACVRAGQVYPATDDYLTIPGPRLLEGLAELVAIHRRYDLAHSAAEQGRDKP